MEKLEIERLLKSSDPFERIIAIKSSPIEIVVKIAETEENQDVAEVIVQKLNEEKESDVVKESYAKLANSKSCIVRKFVAENALIEIVVKMAETEEKEEIVYQILKRLKKEKESDIVIESYAKLANAKSEVIRKFVVENAPIEIVVKMAETEEDWYVVYPILQRLNKEKNSDIVKESYAKLANAKYWRIRGFVAENAPIEIVVKMAETEEDEYLAELIVQRLDEENESDIVIESYAKLANSKRREIHVFVAENAPIKIVVKMAETEEDKCVAKRIVRRLNGENESNIVRENYAKLANAKSEVIRNFAVENAPIEIVVKIAETEENWQVVDLIVRRLNLEKKSDTVRESYAKLANSKRREIREFVVENAPIEIVVKMAETEEDWYVAPLIVQRLTKYKDMIYEESIKKINKVSQVYMDSICIVLSKSEKIEHRLFVVKNASKSILMDMLKSETNEEVLLEILKRRREDNVPSN